MQVYLYSVFSNNEDGGNPCAVVNNSVALTDDQMQKIATSLDLPETIFIIKESQKIFLRFFASKGELPLCVHGGLAAAYKIFNDGYRGERLSIFTYKESKELIFLNNSPIISMVIERNQAKILPNFIEKESVTNFLNLPVAQIDKNSPLGIASIGSPKLLIPVISRKVLFSITPNNETISQWSKDNKVNGVYVYSKETINAESDFVARNFNPLFSANEDIATGVAAGALAVLLEENNKLNKNFSIEQGFNLQKPSLIKVTLSPNTIQIGGKVKIKETDKLRF